MFRSTLEVSPEVTGRLTESTRALARAEWVQWSALLEAADRLDAEVDRIDDHFHRMTTRSAIPLTLGRATGLSEGQVSSRLAVAARLRAHAPGVWAAFEDGRIDGARARELSRALDKLKLPESWQRLDHVGLAYAETHTVTEVRAWLKRFVARVEPEGFNARADEERGRRRVEIVHGDDGMSWLSLYGPSYVIAAVDNRLEARAGELKMQADPDDERTKDQVRADLLAEWMLSRRPRSGKPEVRRGRDCAGHRTHRIQRAADRISRRAMGRPDRLGRRRVRETRHLLASDDHGPGRQ
jgi:hypothetical protein